MPNLMHTPEYHAYDTAIRTVCHLDAAIERAKRNLALSIMRNRKQPHDCWRKRIAEYRAEIARLEADRDEAKIQVDTLFRKVREVAV